MPYDKGLDQDMSPAFQPPDTYRFAQNLSLTREVGIAMSEEGNSLLASLPIGSKLIGKASFPDGSVALFVTGTKDGIYIFSGSTATVVIEDGPVLFNFGSWVQAVGTLSNRNERILYWVDDVNVPRRLNLDTLSSTVLDAAVPLNLFYSFESIPQVFLDLNPTGGVLKSGVYRVAIALVDKEGSDTPYISLSSGQAVYLGPVTDPRATVGAEANTPTNRSLTVRIPNIADFKRDFRGMKIALIKEGDVMVLPEQVLSDRVTITGAESFETGSVYEIVVAPTSYQKALAITEQNEKLYLGNLKRAEDVEYQRFANAITTKYKTETFPLYETIQNYSGGFQATGPSSGMRDGDRFSRLRGYKRGETYAFYISLILKDGSESPAYHIPGRPSLANESNTPQTGGPNFSDPTAAAQIGATKAFQLDANPGPSEGAGNPRRMAYWENDTEKYPDAPEYEIWDVNAQGVGVHTGNSLANQPVRHHQMPDNVTSPAFALNNSGFQMGVVFSNIKFPAEILSRIVGYKIYRAYRGPENQRVVDQSAIHPVRISNDFGITNWTRLASGGTSRVASGADGTNNQLRAAMPFHMLRTHRSTSAITYIKGVAKLGSYGENTISNGGLQIANSKIFERTFKYESLIDAVYVGADARDVGLESNVINNMWAPEALFFKMRRQTAYANDIVDFCTLITNQYTPFSSQTLVWTGYQSTDLSNAFSGITTQVVFGGDIFVTTHTMTSIDVTDRDDGGARIFLNQQAVESLDLTALRHEGPLPYETYFPISKPRKNFSELDDDFDQDLRDRWFFNYIYYNNEYSSGENIRVAFPFNANTQRVVDFPNRVARSSGGLRTFLSEDYKEIGTKRGPIVKLIANQGNLLIHCKRSLFRTKGNEELAVGDVKAYIGSGDIFGPEPEELFGTDEGYGGLSHPHSSMMSPAGYMFVDVEGRRIFSLSDGLKDISTLGLRKHFKALISPNAIPIIGYDPYLDRTFFTISGETISFLPDRGVWESFHSGVPDFYFSTANRMYSTIDNDIYGKGMGTTYYGEEEAVILEVVSNDPPHSSKVLVNALLHVQFEQDGVIDWKQLPDSIHITNDHQDTGLIPLVYFNEPGGNARKTGEIWKINGIRDQIPRTLNSRLPDWNRKRMSGTYHTMRVSFVAVDGYTMRIFGLELAPRPSYR